MKRKKAILRQFYLGLMSENFSTLQEYLETKEILENYYLAWPRCDIDIDIWQCVNCKFLQAVTQHTIMYNVEYGYKCEM